jgi:cytochrome bd ubiquinol oxidase subunit II
MTWVALIFTPVVLAYQGWTYWVFRHRVTGPAGPVSQAPSGP